MDPITQQAVLAAAGAAATGEATYVDDVFSTFLYEGNGSSTSSTQTINNGIDISGEGGLVWIKNREATSFHQLFDTERGAGHYIKSSATTLSQSGNYSLSSFNSNGFTLLWNAGVNGNNQDLVSWTFRQAPGFFDVVTYTGNGSVRTISHNLGSVPGMIICKRLDASSQWPVWHRSVSLNTTAKLQLEESSAAANSANMFTATAPTSTEFTIGTHSNINTNGGTYVAYLFAHDDQSFGTDSDEAIIKCGSYTGNGSTTGPVIDLGFEPQWLLVKLSSTSGGYWVMLDNMRGVNADGGTSILYANVDNQEVTSTFASFSSTGFQPRTGSNYMNSSGQTYIYMAIRRPHKPPTAGTDVFKAVQTTSQPISVGFPTDLHISAETNSGGARYLVPRLTNGYLNSNSTATESAGSTYFKFDLQDSFSTGSFWGSAQTINWQFRRAPGFFDVVVYSGSSSVQNIPHNLQVEPELMIIKIRGRSFNWEVYNKPSGNTKYMQLNRTNGHIGNPAPHWNQTTPTSTHFTVGTNAGGVNYNGDTHIAYLFASLDGISKVGSYSGTGSNINVDCGFTAGARFVLIKQTEPAGTGSSGDWYVWDSTRGIVSGNDPYLLLNTTAAQVTSTDYIDPLNAGFTVTSSAPAALNTSGGTYLFLAIA